MFGRSVARLGFALGAMLALAGHAQALSYSLVDIDLPNCKGPCPKLIVATGTIGQQEHVRFAEFLDGAGDLKRVSTMVLIHSGGGFNVGGVALGVFMRRAKMTVLVGQHTGGPITRPSGLAPGTCASACVLVLAGGQKRHAVPGSRVGVHRSHTGPEVRDPVSRGVNINGKVDYQGVAAAYDRYFKAMGISQELTRIVDKTPSESIYWLSTAEMSKLRLATPFGRR